MSDATRLETLEERLEAAQRDAKEAEAYAEDLEAKLAKAVGALRLSRDAINGLVDSGDAFDDINATLAELTGENT